ncbi:MAG: hypothetical protein MRK00_05850 [Nitrosomonas sp.]|nr:hypothetical protein [Nitrosomonas sp.]
MKKSNWLKCLMFAILIGTAGWSTAQVPTSSFSVLGYIQELDVDDLDDPLSKGFIVVNGLRITLPKNLLITMPGQYLTLNDIFRGPHPFDADGLLKPATKPSGLALLDRNQAPVPPTIAPAVLFEAEIIGNIVNGEYIAGVVRISQGGLNAGEGFIQSIDYEKGELLVGPEAGTGVATARVRINDPEGKYGKLNKDKFPENADVMDERFSSDPGNAPIVAETGFPMCIPRSDPSVEDALCPISNRPEPLSKRRFTCGSVPAIDPTAEPHATCDPTKRMPLQPGDFITFSGMLTEETPNSGNWFIAAHAIQAKLGVYTSPGIDPAYVLIEEAIVGTLGQPFRGVDQEETSRFRLVGFTTDPSRRVDVFVLDSLLDGTEQERRMTTLFPSPTAQVGRIRITLPAKANFLPITRDVRIRIENHVSLDVGGLDSGQYTAPVSEYIYPENTRFGQHKNPVSVPFENFCFLKNGSGPLTTLGRSATGAPSIGRLIPFPDSGHGAAQLRADGNPACL